MSQTESTARQTESTAAPVATTGSLRVPTSGAARVRDWLRTSPTGLIALALVVGAGAGVGAIIFRCLIVSFTHLFSGHADYSAAGHAANPLVPWLGPFFVVLAPVVG